MVSRKPTRVPPTIAVLACLLPLAAIGDSGDAFDQAVARGDFEQALSLADEALASDPDNPALRFERVRALRYGGHYLLAIRELDVLREQFPGDVDYSFERALLLAALDRNAECLAELDAAITKAPGYEDLWKLRFSVMMREPGLAEPASVDAWREEAGHRFPGAAWLGTVRDESPVAWSMSFGGGYDQLDNGFDDWNNQFFRVIREVEDASRYALEVNRSARGSTSDLALGATAEFSLGTRWLAGGYLGIASDPNFVPDLDVSVHAARVLPDGWVVDLGLRRRDYAASTVNSAIATVEKYAGAFRFAYRLSVSSVTDTPSFPGHGLTVNWFYAEAASVGLTVGAGREVESLGGGRLLETDVESVSVSGRHALNQRVSLDWWLGAHNQGDIYTRRFLGLAVSIQL